MKRTIAITGASGFIGRRLVSELLRAGDCRIRVLARPGQRSLNESRFGKDVEVFEGDLEAPDTLDGFLLPGCTVVNLVYLWEGGKARNLACIRNLLQACRGAGIARLIHCSTAAVAGRAAGNLINETTPCLPVSEYGITKLQIEHDIAGAAKGHFDAVILRPTSVFGIGGEPLKKLAADVSTGSVLKNYLKSCLFGRRRMNLVHVANVVAAIIFLIGQDSRFDGEVLIVSDDDDPMNNFADIEAFLIGTWGIKGYSLPRLPLPLGMLELLLRMLGRNNVNPRCDFDPSKLRALGFRPPLSLREGLAEYAAWYRSTHSGRQGAAHT
ncbi:MAG TPA: NAD-dependent epimerase/dehydratase family protein [Sideroxyarcus sp.]|nr:NAD-dependent epimerase/dehydratase family protein [Sideroxyarcus sp.]